jgi:hypothetical protein
MSLSTKNVDSTNPTQVSALVLLEQLRHSQQPVVLTINGQKELLVEDSGSYQLLLKLVERLETIDGVKKSMEAFERGEGQPAQEALKQLCQKHGIPS